MSVLRRRNVVAWALYDWANSSFATTVMAGFFPVFFKQYWSAGSEATVSTFRLGIGNGIASALIALLAPLLGAIADRGGARVKLLLLFTVLGVAMTAALYWVQRGDWPLAVLFYALAAVGFSGGTTFYDSLLLDVAEEREFDLVSGYGYALGYLGGGLLFLLNVVMTLKPELFGLADAGAGSAGVFSHGCDLVGGFYSAVAALRARTAGNGAAAAACGATVPGGPSSGRRLRTCAPIARCTLFLARLLALHRWRQYGHQDGRGLRPVTRLRIEEPDRRTADHAVRGVPRSPRRSAGLASASGRAPESWCASRVYLGVTVWAYFLENVTPVLHHGDRHRPGAGWYPEPEPLVFRTPRAAAEIRRVLRLLQHDGQICGGDRPRADGRGWRSQPAARGSRSCRSRLLFAAGGAILWFVNEPATSSPDRAGSSS